MGGGFATHQAVLTAVLKRINKPVLELGAGDYSTELIHKELDGRNIRIVTVDDKPEWIAKFFRLYDEFHDFIYMNKEDTLMYFKADRTKWGLVFVDCGVWEVRGMAVKKYKDIADFILVHDCDYFPENNTNTNYTKERFFGRVINHANTKTMSVGKRDYSDTFKYWVEFFEKNWDEESPPVLLGSNKINLDDFEVPGMIVSGRNKKIDGKEKNYITSTS